MDTRTTMSKAHVAYNSNVARPPGDRHAEHVVGISPLLFLFESEGLVVSKVHFERTIFLGNIHYLRPRVKPFTVVRNTRNHDVAIKERHIFKGRLVVSSLHNAALSRVMDPFNLQSLSFGGFLRFRGVVSYPTLLPMVVDCPIVDATCGSSGIGHSTDETESVFLELLAKFCTHDIVMGLDAVTNEGPTNPWTIDGMLAEEAKSFDGVRLVCHFVMVC
mmetsp:Transcript_3555/g.6871  ORF Transcript_3555/g.6871 Transcript_3555/m.6871 type:complete len:218 (-) Transcript_3555:392-1045(-)